MRTIFTHSLTVTAQNERIEPPASASGMLRLQGQRRFARGAAVNQLQ